MIQKEENLNDNVSNDTNETISRLKEKYKQRREYSIGYIEFVNDIINYQDFNSLYDMEVKCNSTYQKYHQYLNRVRKINELGI